MWDMYVLVLASSGLSTHMGCRQLVDSLSCWVFSSENPTKIGFFFQETPRSLGGPKIAATVQERKRYVSLPCIHMVPKDSN